MHVDVVIGNPPTHFFNCRTFWPRQEAYFQLLSPGWEQAFGAFFNFMYMKFKECTWCTSLCPIWPCPLLITDMCLHSRFCSIFLFCFLEVIILIQYNAKYSQYDMHSNYIPSKRHWTYNEKFKPIHGHGHSKTCFPADAILNRKRKSVSS